MGFFSDIKAMKEVQRIKKRGTAKLSISQITGLITNMSDAQKNLSSQQFEKVYTLFKELRKCNSKMEMDIEDYYKTAVSIIKRFDVLAPYEKYSGGNELEFSFLMDEIRNSRAADSKEFLNLNIYCDPRDAEEDISNMMDTSCVAITREEAKEILAVCMCNQVFGKEAALNAFDTLARQIISENTEIEAIGKISFFAGVLFPNGVVSKAESDELSKKYTEPILEKVKEKINSLSQRT